MVEAALAIADSEGIEGLSMGAVAARLETGPMTLYRYVPSKGVLTLLLADRAQLAPNRSDPTGQWRDDLRSWSRTFRDIYDAHPWLLDVPITGAPLLPNEVANLEVGLRAIAPAGLDAPQSLLVLRSLAAFVRNEAIQRRSLASGSLDMRTYAEALAELINEGDYSVLAGILAENTLRVDDLEDDFEPGLALLIAGIDEFAVEG
ncbi:TetR/AcrR family transcriptional regulator C-terminal domain-containing protein [Microbacterium testaceum]|uniref:TetR/AcrR family transcriptional regulator n=1 Tax=Microbacterium testaceum TaxID=2033 RepID=UPI00341422F0